MGFGLDVPHAAVGLNDAKLRVELEGPVQRRLALGHGAASRMKPLLPSLDTAGNSSRVRP